MINPEIMATVLLNNLEKLSTSRSSISLSDKNKGSNARYLWSNLAIQRNIEDKDSKNTILVHTVEGPTFLNVSIKYILNVNSYMLFQLNLVL